MKRILTILAATLFVLVCLLTIPQHANASTNPGGQALSWAEAHALNAPYWWGGTGPGYDCSGIVMTALEHEGVWLPHNTEAMIQSGKLYRIPWSWRHRGDLLFWFSGGYAYHVEFQTAYSRLGFGAETYGWAGRVTWHPIWGSPVVYRIR
jgi:hypothetical protein